MRFARSVSTALAVLVAAGTAACAGTPGGDDDEATTAAAEATTPVQTTGIESLGDITLKVAFSENDPGPKKSLQELTATFMEKYPNVKVQSTFQAFDPYMKKVKLVASGDSPPDVFAGNQGYGTDGELVKAKLILPLDRYAEAYGWEEAFGEGTLQQFRWTPDGKTFGEGSIYGVGSAGEAVGLFYNEKKLKALGYDGPPETLEEFEEMLAKAKAAGEQPIMAGNQEGWPAIHIWGSVQGQYASAQQVRDAILGAEGASYDTPENQEAAAKLAEWVEKGYFPKNINGLPADTGGANFRKGQGVFHITGTWATADMAKENPDIRFANMPVGKSGKRVQTGSLSVPYHVSVKSEHPDVGAAFIDHITNADAAEILIANGRVPAVPTDIEADSPIANDTIAAWKELKDDDGLALYPDWATNTMYDTMAAAMGGILGGKLDGPTFVERLQADFEKFTSSRA
jgi:raffinose/stachyose/melibiose transport system substrate-binding protein